MNLSVYADNSHFLVSVNGKSLDLSTNNQPAIAIVDEGSIIRISTDYERDFVIGPDKEHIGMFFENGNDEPLRFQNVYCIVPDCGKTTHGSLRLELCGQTQNRESDDYPYLPAFAHITCPTIIDGNWWHFLPALSHMKKLDTKAFRIMEKFYIIGFAFAKTVWKGYDYRIYRNIDLFNEHPGTVGIAYDYGSKTFTLVERDILTDGLITTNFDSADALYQSIKERL